jgi:cell division protein FtsW
MAKRVGVDKWLFGIVLLLVLFGLVEVFSASAVMAKATVGSAYSYVARQALWALLGLVAMTVLMQIDYRKYNNKKFIYTLVAIELVLLVGLFAMHDSHHTHRWIRFGGLFTFQPSEIAKPILILYLSYFLQSKIHLMDDLKGTVLKAVALPALFTVLIAAEPDLGTALVCVGVTVFMLYLAGAKVWHLSIPLMAAAPALAYMLLMVPWRLARIRVFMNPEADPRGAGFHILQSLIAVGTGGFRGLGLMEGRQKLFYLPEPHTDFIFANVCEELGLIGAIFIVGLFVALAYRGFRAAVLSTDPFARFLAFGLSTAILVQAFFNISVVLALVPTKGIPLPFISSGGTSVFITLAGMGVLLNITREID